LDRRIDEVEVEDTFPMVGRNTAASTVADILKTKQAVLVVEKGRAIGIVTRHDVIEKSWPAGQYQRNSHKGPY